MTHNVPNRNWSYPTAIKFGVGRIAELAEHAASAGLKKPLLVTDKALAALPITKAALDVLETAGLGRAVFSDVDPNPNEINMAEGIAVYKAGGHDGVICFGGAASRVRRLRANSAVEAFRLASTLRLANTTVLPESDTMNSTSSAVVEG